MDLETIFTAIAGAGSVAATVGYSIKKIVDRSIDAKCSRITERAIAEFRKETQRRLTSLDQPFEVFKTTLSLTDRARKCCRDLQNVIDTGIVSAERLEQMHRLKNYADTILDILMDEKAHISPIICATAQEVKTLLQEYPWNAETFLRSWRKDSGSPLMESAFAPLKAKIAECHRRIDGLYDLIREEVQHRWGDVPEGMNTGYRGV